MEESSDSARPSRWMSRRRFLIDRRFQLRYTALLVLVGVLISSVLGFCVFCLLRENRDLLDLDAAMMERVQRFDNLTLLYLIGFVVVMAVFLFCWGILITHRVAGPLLVIQRFLGELAAGRIPRSRPLRKRDELQKFYETFFNMVDALQKRHAEDLEILQFCLQELKDKHSATTVEMIGKLEALVKSKQSWGVPSDDTTQ